MLIQKKVQCILNNHLTHISEWMHPGNPTSLQGLQMALTLKFSTGFEWNEF